MNKQNLVRRLWIDYMRVQVRERERDMYSDIE